MRLGLDGPNQLEPVRQFSVLAQRKNDEAARSEQGSSSRDSPSGKSAAKGTSVESALAKNAGAQERIAGADTIAVEITYFFLALHHNVDQSCYTVRVRRQADVIRRSSQSAFRGVMADIQGTSGSFTTSRFNITGGSAPMTRGQIARELAARGTPLAGRNVNKNLGTILWRHQDTFVNLEGLGYWLAEVELPGIYTPPR